MRAVPPHFLRRLFAVAAVLGMPVFAVAGQAIDRVDIAAAGSNEVDIIVRFTTPIQLIRSAPPQGKLLRVFVRLINPPVPEADLMQETLSAPVSPLVPRVTVTYPELANGVAIAFSADTRWRVRAGEDDRSFVVTVPALPVPGAKRDTKPEAKPEPAPALVPKPEPKPAPQPEPKPEPAPIPAKPAETEPAPAVSSGVTEVAPQPPALTPDQVEALARRFMDEARLAVTQKDMAKAVNRLNRTLGLPTNSQTEPAQVMIGEVREMTGEVAKARAEYELYLKLFPSGPNVASVKERLAKLPAASSRIAQRPTVPKEAGPAEWTYYGALSQFYYNGKSQIEVITPPPPGQLTFTTDNLSMTDQNALITAIDLNARRRDGIRDTRIVFRDTDTRSFLTKGRSYNRLYSAYVEQSDRSVGYTVRAGRQNPVGGGVLERFDGVFGGYNFAEGWRVNAVAGIPVEFMSTYKKQFVGFSLDRLAQPEAIGFSPYILEQRMEGQTNRRAIGTEVRYFDSHAAAFGLFDYDLAFRDLNIVMLQGNYRMDSGANLFTYFDHRKTPPLSLTNAIAGLPGLSIKEALDQYGVDQLRSDAKALTAMSDMLAIGFTHPYSPQWTLGADYRAARISGTEAAGVMPATQGSGVNHVITGQAIGSDLWLDNDVAVANASLVLGQDYTGQALGLSYVFVYGDPWRFDANMRFYHQKDDSGQTQNRLSPSFKLSYRWKTVTLECEVGAENVHMHGPLREETSNRHYLYVGYRWELR